MNMAPTITSDVPREAESLEPLPALAHTKIIRLCAGLNWALGSPATQFRRSNDSETVVRSLVPARSFIPPGAVRRLLLAEGGDRRVA